jgi:hypothetical protein
MRDPHKGKSAPNKALAIQKARRSIHIASKDGQWTPEYGFKFLEGTAPRPPGNPKATRKV